jgi:hypothetical protein
VELEDELDRPDPGSFDHAHDNPIVAEVTAVRGVPAAVATEVSPRVLRP